MINTFPKDHMLNKIEYARTEDQNITDFLINSLFIRIFFSFLRRKKNKKLAKKTRHSHCVHRYKTLYRLNQLHIDLKKMFT